MSISTLSLNAASRASIMRLQTELRDATREATTGRHADVGAALGRFAGNAVTYRAQESSIQGMLDSNKLVTTRLTVADKTLEALAKSGDSFRSGLINGVATESGVSALVTTARNSLAQLTGASGLNLQVDGQYIFAGTQSDVQPMRDGMAEIAADFDSYLASLPADATTGSARTRSTVTAAEIEAYFAPLPGSSASRFDNVVLDASWTATGKALVDGSTARISSSETIRTSVNANEAAFRQMAVSYAMIASLGVEQMGEGARKAVVTAAQAKLTAGLDAVTDIRADMGARQNRITAANTALTQQQDIVEAAYKRLEGVDETEAALRMNSLKTQLDTSYAVTGRIQSLSILNYL